MCIWMEYDIYVHIGICMDTAGMVKVNTTTHMPMMCMDVQSWHYRYSLQLPLHTVTGLELAQLSPALALRQLCALRTARTVHRRHRRVGGQGGGRPQERLVCHAPYVIHGRSTLNIYEGGEIYGKGGARRASDIYAPFYARPRPRPRPRAPRSAQPCAMSSCPANTSYYIHHHRHHHHHHPSIAYRCVADTNTYGTGKVIHSGGNVGWQDRCNYYNHYGLSNPERGLHGFTCSKMVQLLRLQP